MLPSVYFPDDEKWILSQMRRIPTELCEKAAKGYEKVWNEAFSAGTELSAEGEARRAANTRLREYADALSDRGWQ